MSTYYFLQDAYVNGQFIQAGSTAVSSDVGTVLLVDNSGNVLVTPSQDPLAVSIDAGGILPPLWTPGPFVDPQDTPAVNAFYAVGPTETSLLFRQQFYGIPVNAPVTYWIQLPNIPVTSNSGGGGGGGSGDFSAADFSSADFFLFSSGSINPPTTITVGFLPGPWALTGLGANQSIYPPVFRSVPQLP